ncbi:MAG: ABC transporter permease [Pseudomonadales bacterium]
MRCFRLFTEHWAILLSTTRQQLKTRFVGSVFGLAWLILYPLMFLGMYSLVFIKILGIRIPELSTIQYVLVIFCGLVPFLAFTQAFSLGSVSVVSNGNLVKNTLFPIELVVARDVLAAYIAMSAGVLIVWAVVSTERLYWSHLALVPIYLLQFLMTLGFAWIASTLMVFFRDLQQLLPVLTLFLMLVSPIAYTMNMVPEGLRDYFLFNPLAWYMEIYRAVLMEGEFPVLDVLAIAAMSVGIFIIGYEVIHRMKSLFSDYV